MARCSFSAVVLCLLVSSFAFGAGGDMGGGSGTAGDPYLIEDLADFDVFADPINSATYWASGVHTKLACDPNLTGRTYTTAVIAPDSSSSSGFQGTSFAGIFDGDGHTIGNLTIDTAGADNDYLGLFGNIDSAAAEVKNLGVVNCNITGGFNSRYLGGLCGRNFGGIITNCFTTDVVVTGGYYLGCLCGENRGTITNCYATGSGAGWISFHYFGGLCGRNSGTLTNCYATGSVSGGNSSNYVGGLCGGNYNTITNCYATGSVSGGDYSRNLGGLCGRNFNGPITNCYATGSVTGIEYVGGLCGYNSEHGTMNNCYATGSVEGNERVGGLLGVNLGTAASCYCIGSVRGNEYVGGLSGNVSDGTIINCYSTGSVSGNSYIGGLCGMVSLDVIITNCFWDVDTSTISDPEGGLAGTDTDGMTGMTTTQMQTMSNFTDAGWDFNSIWIMPQDGSPVLSWEIGLDVGSGIEADPFLISNKQDVLTLSQITNPVRIAFFFKLTQDIDMAGEVFVDAVIKEFHGTFDGDGHVISNFEINAPGIASIGLFGILESSATVKGLGVENISVTGLAFIGALAGYNLGSITNCYSTGNASGVLNVGSLCGDNRGSIDNCYSTGIASGEARIGGLCGNNRGSIDDCYSTGNATGIANYIGGLCGENYNGVITNCYSTGSVTGPYDVGGLCARNFAGSITGCFWDVETSDLAISTGGTGLTTAQMQMQSTFTDAPASWDFVSTWWINDGRDYPRLYWQPFGDLNNDSHVNVFDLGVMSAAWGASDGDANYNSVCELSGDNTIDAADLFELTGMWMAGPF